MRLVSTRAKVLQITKVSIDGRGIRIGGREMLRNSVEAMRRVSELNDGKVTYEAWSANQERPSNPTRFTVNEGNFCADVDRSVACSHREGFGGK